MTDLLRVRTVFNYGAGSPGLMTQYFASDTGIYNNAVAQLAVDRVRDAMASQPALWPPQFNWDILGDVDLLHDTDGVVFDAFGVTSRQGVGTAGAGLGPLPVGLLLRTETGAHVSGRRLSGRTYLVPVSAAITDKPAPTPQELADTKVVGTALSNAGATALQHFVWSRPRPATAVGPGRPAGPARLARVGSSAIATGYSVSPRFCVLRSRRD